MSADQNATDAPEGGLDTIEGLILSDCHNARIYYKDFGFPIEEMGANCTVCNKKCKPVANPKCGIVGEFQLLIGYDLQEVAPQILALITKTTKEAYQNGYVDAIEKKQPKYLLGFDPLNLPVEDHELRGIERESDGSQD